MSEEREKILSALRPAFGRGGAPLPTVVSERLERPPVGPQPVLPGAPVSVFVERLKAAAATVSRAGSPSEAVQAIVRYLDEQTLPHELVSDLSALITGLPWPADVAVRPPPFRVKDRVAVTSAYAAIAETGSLALLSSGQTPASLSYLPDHHICLLAAGRVVTHLEDLWALMRRESKGVPRSLALVTGPSRTADVEQTIQMGAHGPRSVHVVLLGD